MQTLKADLNPSRDLKSVKDTMKGQKNRNGKNVLRNDQQFSETIEKLLFVKQKPTAKTKVKELNQGQEQKETKDKQGDELLTSAAMVFRAPIATANKSPTTKNEAKPPIDVTGNSDSRAGKSTSPNINSITLTKPEAAVNKLESSTSETKLTPDVTGNNVKRGEKPDLPGVNNIAPAKLEAAVNKLEPLTNETKLTPDVTASNAKRGEKPDLASINSIASSKTEAAANRLEHSAGEAKLSGNSAVNKVSQPEKTDYQSSDNEMQRKSSQDISKVEKRKEKIEVYNFQSSIGKNGLTELNVVINSGSNLEKTMLSKPQIDTIVAHLVQQTKVAPSSLEINLEPAALGKIKLLVQSNEGQISIRITAHNGETANLLNSSLQYIRENLEQQGINLQQMDVDLANQEKSGNQTRSGFREESQQPGTGEQSQENYQTVRTQEQNYSQTNQLNLWA